MIRHREKLDQLAERLDEETERVEQLMRVLRHLGLDEAEIASNARIKDRLKELSQEEADELADTRDVPL